MNSNCHGHWIPRLRVYRCFKDGKIVSLSGKPSKCPNCERLVVCKTLKKPTLRVLAVSQVQVPGLGWVDVTHVQSGDWHA